MQNNNFLTQHLSSTLSFLRRSLPFPIIENTIKKKNLGDWWDRSSNHEHNVTTAYTSGLIRSIDEFQSTATRKELKVKFVNKSPRVLVLCWVSASGTLHHYYHIAPYGSHVEKTVTGDAFVLSLLSDTESPMTKPNQEGEEAEEEEKEGSKEDNDHPTVNDHTIVAAYRPMHITSTVNEDCCKCKHLVVINAYRNTPAFLRRKTRRSKDNKEHEKMKWKLYIREDTSKRVGPLIDTRDKVYVLEMFGPWRVQCEPGCWGDEECDTQSQDGETNSTRLSPKEQFKFDLVAATKRLPKHAKELFCNSTTIWINKSFRHGCAEDPTEERGACFHPDKKWLQEHNYSTRKLYGIEFYNSTGYLEDRHLWGTYVRT